MIVLTALCRPALSSDCDQHQAGTRAENDERMRVILDRYCSKSGMAGPSRSSCLNLLFSRALEVPMDPVI